MTFGTVGAKSLIKVAPLKGSFPIDHEGDCRQIMQEYLLCVRENKGDAIPCRQITRRYLECRMQNGLMAEEPLSLLGFPDNNISGDAQSSSTTNVNDECTKKMHDGA